MVAGEASGDLLASHLIAAIRARLPGAVFSGIGGAHMIAQGFDAWWPAETLAVRGYVEVLRHYRGIAAIRGQLKQRLLQAPPDLFIGVDAPDFNLDLEVALRAAGIRTAHFISPSIWAWRGARMDKIRRAVGHMLCVFPFEEKLYRDAGVGATYVGHPLADVIALAPDRDAARIRLGIAADAPLIALLPGSRVSELRYLADRFVRAAGLLHAADPCCRFAVPLAGDATARMWAEAVLRNDAAHVPMTVAPGGAHAVLAACDVAMVASGTATLEAALFKRPMVIAYNMAPLSWQMMRRMAYLPYVGLPNILCGEFVVPELLQDDASPENLAQAAGNLMVDAGTRTRIAGRFARLHRELRHGMAARAAETIAEQFFPAATADA